MSFISIWISMKTQILGRNLITKKQHIPASHNKNLMMLIYLLIKILMKFETEQQTFTISARSFTFTVKYTPKQHLVYQLQNFQTDTHYHLIVSIDDAPSYCGRYRLCDIFQASLSSQIKNQRESIEEGTQISLGEKLDIGFSQTIKRNSGWTIRIEGDGQIHYCQRRRGEEPQSIKVVLKRKSKYNQIINNEQNCFEKIEALIKTQSGKIKEKVEEQFERLDQVQQRVQRYNAKLNQMIEQFKAETKKEMGWLKQEIQQKNQQIQHMQKQLKAYQSNSCILQEMSQLSDKKQKSQNRPLNIKQTTLSQEKYEIAQQAVQSAKLIIIKVSDNADKPELKTLASAITYCIERYGETGGGIYVKIIVQDPIKADSKENWEKNHIAIQKDFSWITITGKDKTLVVDLGKYSSGGTLFCLSSGALNFQKGLTIKIMTTGAQYTFSTRFLAFHNRQTKKSHVVLFDTVTFQVSGFCQSVLLLSGTRQIILQDCKVKYFWGDKEPRPHSVNNNHFIQFSGNNLTNSLTLQNCQIDMNQAGSHNNFICLKTRYGLVTLSRCVFLNYTRAIQSIDNTLHSARTQARIDLRVNSCYFETQSKEKNYGVWFVNSGKLTISDCLTNIYFIDGLTDEGCQKSRVVSSQPSFKQTTPEDMVQLKSILSFNDIKQ